MVGRWTDEGADLVEATVESPCYDAVHTRRLAFCGNEYWVLHDLLRAPTEHRYELRWHLGIEAQGRTRIKPTDETVTVSTPHGRFVIAGADSVDLEPGWVSEEYGVKVPAPVIVARATGRSANLLTVVLPDASAHVSHAAADAAGCVVHVHHDLADEGHLDLFDWPVSGGPATWQRRGSPAPVVVELAARGDRS